jgi:hypothetical protein
MDSEDSYKCLINYEHLNLDIFVNTILYSTIICMGTSAADATFQIFVETIFILFGNN